MLVKWTGRPATVEGAGAMAQREQTGYVRKDNKALVPGNIRFPSALSRPPEHCRAVANSLRSPDCASWANNPNVNHTKTARGKEAFSFLERASQIKSSDDWLLLLLSSTPSPELKLVQTHDFSEHHPLKCTHLNQKLDYLPLIMS